MGIARSATLTLPWSKMTRLLHGPRNSTPRCGLERPMRVMMMFGFGWMDHKWQINTGEPENQVTVYSLMKTAWPRTTNPFGWIMENGSTNTANPSLNSPANYRECKEGEEFFTWSRRFLDIFLYCH